MISCVSLRFRRYSFVFIAFSAWLALGLAMFADESLYKHEERLRERMLERAEAYLNSVDQAAAPKIVPYVSVVRGLIQAGFSVEHPFLQSKSDALLQIVPRNRHEAAGQREIALLRSFGHRAACSPSGRDSATIQAAVFSDLYFENYRRFGAVYLPRGGNSDRPGDLPFPNHKTEHFQIAVSNSSSSSRLSEIGDLPDSSLDLVFSSNDCRRLETDRQPSFVLIAQTVRLRN